MQPSHDLESLNLGRRTQVVLSRDELSRLLTASREEGFLLAMLLLNRRFR